jgi:hypothetical protein
MTDRPDPSVRLKALKDAEAALVDARLQREEQQLVDTQTRLTRALPYRPTDVEIVVDAVLASIAGAMLTPDEAALAATAIRHRAGELRYRARINPLDVSVRGTDQDALLAVAAKLEAL